MRSLVFDGPHRFHIEDKPQTDPGPGQVQMRVAYVGICGSDLHGYTGESGRRVPGMVMGHEASGWIEDVGVGVEDLEIGQPVTFIPTIPCGGECGHEIDNQCYRIELIGVTPRHRGAFADTVLIPADCVVPLGSLDLLRGAVAEPLAVALQATRRADVRDGDDVLVIGGGMIGHCIGQTARYLGAAKVTISEGMPERRALAEAAGFHTITPEVLPEAPPFDRVLDAVGIDATAAASIRAVAKGGVVCFVGLGAPEVKIPLFDIVTAERSITGSFCYTHDVFKETVALLQSGQLDADLYIGATTAFEGVAEAFEDLATGRRTDIKIMMATGASAP
ncbi:MAG TPA: alcohol dehydrogenase catalytic domain-containing protein [Acidimicrobiia bacterium]|nr:alcohol dehydrogenase catalytic domain-containing protein [Acidimicrobiia bacterium]